MTLYYKIFYIASTEKQSQAAFSLKKGKSLTTDNGNEAYGK